MNKYLCFGKNNKKIEVEADSSFKAQLKATELLKQKTVNITVYLQEVDGQQYSHSTNSI